MSMARPPLTAAWLHLAPTASAVSCARAFVAHTLRVWGCPGDDLRDSAILIMSELVTNAVRATGIADRDPVYADLENLGLIAVQLRVQGKTLFIEVWDDSTERPTARVASDDAEGGRGLFLVESMGSGWGTYLPPVGGKVVYAELGLTETVCSAGELEPLPTRVRRAITTEPRHLHAVASAALLERVLEGLQRL